MEFGKLKEVDVRELWKHEQYNFSEWLAKEENIEMLGDEVGVTFAEIRKESLIFFNDNLGFNFCWCIQM